MSATEAQFRSLGRALAAVWMIVLILLAGVTAVRSLGHKHAESDYRSKLQAAHRHALVYQIIAGQRDSDSADTSVTLAYDLRKVLGPTDPQARSLPFDIVHFDGNNNSYGGITKQLGYNPFAGNGQGCSECGPLSASFKAKLLLIKRGQVGTVIEQETPSAPPAAHTDIAGLSVIEILLLLYLLGSPVMFAAAWQLSMHHPQSRRFKRFGQLSWELDGDNTGQKAAIMAMAPTLFGPYKLYQRLHPGDTYTPGAARRKNEVLDQVRAIEGYESDIQDSNVRRLLTSICDNVRTLLERVEESSPTTLLSIAGNLKANLANLEAVIKQYIDIEQNPKYHDEPVRQLHEYQGALRSLDEQLLSHIRKVESGETLEVGIAAKMLQAAQYKSL